MKVCFFAHVPDRETLERVGFYAQDVRILREVGCDLTVATSWREIPWDADVYFVWWWTWAFLPVIKARVRGRPVIITGVFNYDLGEPSRLAYPSRPWLQRKLIKGAARQAAANVFVSEYERRLVADNLAVGNELYCPLSVDVDIYAPIGIVRDSSIVFTIAWLSRANADRKCIKTILSAAPQVLAQHPNTRFLIAGLQGDGFEELNDLAHDLQVAHAVEWMGPISEERKLDLLHRCGVYASPSIFEGFGLAILEAMACGAPIIGSPVGAVPEVLGDAGIMVPGRSSEKLAEAILGLQSDRSLAGRLGSIARSRAMRLFPRERRTAELRALLDRCLA